MFINYLVLHKNPFWLQVLSIYFCFWLLKRFKNEKKMCCSTKQRKKEWKCWKVLWLVNSLHVSGFCIIYNTVWPNWLSFSLYGKIRSSWGFNTPLVSYIVSIMRVWICVTLWEMCEKWSISNAGSVGDLSGERHHLTTRNFSPRNRFTRSNFISRYTFFFGIFLCGIFF